MGHGTQSGALILEDSSGKSKQAEASEVASLFEAVGDQLDCVVLNVSNSSSLARIIAKHVKYVIGMERGISDRAAIVFASHFYHALAFGRSIEDAFELARAGIELEELSDSIEPILVTKGKVV